MPSAYSTSIHVLLRRTDLLGRAVVQTLGVGPAGPGHPVTLTASSAVAGRGGLPGSAVRGVCTARPSVLLLLATSVCAASGFPPAAPVNKSQEP